MLFYCILPYTVHLLPLYGVNTKGVWELQVSVTVQQRTLYSTVPHQLWN